MLLAWALAAAGLLLRLREFGRYAFWNDEAWVALFTRVEGREQLWLALGVTPPLWALALRPLAVLPGPPEVSLRLLPLLFGMLTLWAAFRLGRAFAGRAAGGAAAVAVLAFAPIAIFYSRELKHYTAETFFCLASFALAVRVARRRRGGDLIGLALLLVVGALFATSQVLVAPPLFAALLLVAAARWDRRAIVETAAASAVVGVLLLGYYEVALAPRVNPSLVQSWEGAYVPGDLLADAVAFVSTSVRRLLAFTWGARAVLPALLALAAAVILLPSARLPGLAAALLLVEVAALSSRQLVPFDEPRVILFLLAVLHTLAAAAVAGGAVRLWRRPWLRPLVAAGLLWGVVVIVRDVDRAVVPHQPEELGWSVRRMEQTRGPDDGVLLYERSGYVYAYYQAATPRLRSDPNTTVGFVPELADPRLVVVDGAQPEPAVVQALARHARVWLVASRFRPGDEERVVRVLEARATVVDVWRGTRALVVLAERRDDPP